MLFACLDLMKVKLKRNICNLDNHAIISDVEDISIKRKEHIGDSLEYACRFWARHLLGTPSSGCDAEEITGGSKGTTFQYPNEVHWRLSSSTRKYLECTPKQYITGS